MGRPDQEEVSRLLGNAGIGSSVSDFQDETPYSDVPEPVRDIQGFAAHTTDAGPVTGHQHPSIIITADVDLPPNYDEIQTFESSVASVGMSQSRQTVVRPPASLNFLDGALYKQDSGSGHEYYIDRRLDCDPVLLEQAVRYWATLPPRMYMSVKGTHNETIYRSKNKSERKTVTDFDVRVEITPYLYRDPESCISMCSPRTIDNHEKARRGTCLRKYASRQQKRKSQCHPGLGRIELSDQEPAVADPRKPTLAEWCHRYCASHATLKTFQIERRIIGLDTDLLKKRLTTLVRNTNYRGNICISFPVTNNIVEVYNENPTNRWRFTTWIRVLFYTTMLFLFTWPYLFFATKRFEVVVVDWPYSRYHEDQDTFEYVSITEDQLFNLWGRAIHHAVLSKRVCTLDQQDLITAEGRPPIQTGNQVVDGLVGAGIRAMNVVNQQLGWGRHS